MRVPIYIIKGRKRIKKPIKSITFAKKRPKIGYFA